MGREADYSAMFATALLLVWGGEFKFMTEKNKREKVVAEITAAHLAEFAGGMGRSMTQDEAISFLNKQAGLTRCGSI
jgi:hypothetical protein